MVKRTTLAAQAAFIARRKAELGYEGRSYVPVNSGARRTEAKKELLRALRREARERGMTPPFQARIG